ncbi:MAG: hypothetical protein U9P72_12400 [Campylobacterota bacterium]|nr:hypothetical protein [Campylobacterota bacterium]
MSVLTKNERDGLEDVFSSIYTDNYKYDKLKSIQLGYKNIVNTIVKKSKFNVLNLKKRYNHH